MILLSDEIIPIGEIEKFDNYVRKRFNLKEVSLKITLPPDDRNKRIADDWKDILNFLSKNVAVIKAFLKNSTAEVKDGIITLHLCVKGKVLLEKQGIHNYISEFIKNTYDSNYRVEFVEDNYGEIEQNFDKAKEDIIKEFAESSARAVANKAANNEEEVNRQSENSEKHGNLKTIIRIMQINQMVIKMEIIMGTVMVIVVEILDLMMKCRKESQTQMIQA